MNRLPRSPSAAPRNFLVWLSFPLLALMIFGFAWRPLTGGDDFWAHAAIGRWIVERRQIPTQTLFLWSESVPWIAHAWGTGVWFASLLRWGGERGGPWLAQIFNAAMCIAPFALIWRYWRQNAAFSSLVPPLFILAIWAGAARFHPRPELFTALFLTLLMIFLAQWPRQTELPKLQIAGILLMFAVWPNFHGAVAFGLVFLFIAAITEVWHDRMGKLLLLLTLVCAFVPLVFAVWPDLVALIGVGLLLPFIATLIEVWKGRGDGRLLLLALVCTLLVFVCNPRGFEYYKVLIPIASKTFERIDEWKPFWKWPTLAVELWLGELLLWAIGMGLWLKNPNKRLMQLGWMLLMLAAFLKARRQLWLTALTSLFVIVSNLNFSSDDLFRGWRRLSRGDATQPMPAPLRLIGRVGVLLALVSAIAMAFPKNGLPLQATDPKLPVQMAAFLRDKAPQGRILNDYEFSAYHEWALRDQRTLYIDLNNAYPDSLMDEYFVLQRSSKNAKKMAEYDRKRAQILARRKINLVALRPYTDKEGLSIVGGYVNQNPNWKRVYKGIDGTVWARK